MNKKILIGVIIAVVIIAVVLIFSGGGPSVPGEIKTAKQLENLEIPKVGEESPDEGVGVPGKITEGESGKKEQQYWVFEAELKDGILNPFEFRVPVGNLLGISILNSENKEHTVNISGESEFVPNFIERSITVGGTASMRTQVLEIGEYNIFCTTCKEEVIGKFVVVPKS